MQRVKNEPGIFLPIDEVESKLKAPAYGVSDLVEMGLFHSEHFARDAIATGKLKAQKINKRATIVCRDDVLEYWSIYRNTPYEAANNVMTLRFTISEVDYISSLVDYGQRKVNKEFTKDDLFRNVIQLLRSNYGSRADSVPLLFKKHY